jgi:hypothetical protein
MNANEKAPATDTIAEAETEKQLSKTKRNFSKFDRFGAACFAYWICLIVARALGGDL